MTDTVARPSADDFLGGGGAKSATWPDGAFGMEIGGEIVDDPQVVQQKDYDSGEPKFYQDSGKPVMQLQVIVQTELRDDADDDGRRALYVRGQLKAAVQDAIRESNRQHGRQDKSPQRGGQLFVRYERDEPTPPKNGKPRKPTKVKSARYIPPATAAAASFMDSPEVDAPAATASTAAGLPVPPGMDAGKWGQMSADQQRRMYDAMGLQLPAGQDADPNRPPF